MAAKPTLYSFYTSFFSQKTLMHLYERGVEFDKHIVNLAGDETQSSWFLKINPRGEVPSLKFGEEIINDSENICQYLETNKIGKSLFPTDPGHLSKHNAFRERLVAVPIELITYGTAFHPHLRNNPKMPIKWPLTKLMKDKMLHRSENLRKKAAENSGTPAEAVLLAKADEHDKRLHLYTNEDEQKQMLRDLQTLLDDTENELASHKDSQWLINDEFTSADCILAIILNRLDFLGHEDNMASNARPCLASWWGQAKSRESFIESTKTPYLPLYILKSKLGLIK